MQINNKYVTNKLNDFCILAKWKGGESICKYFKLIEYNPKLRLFCLKMLLRSKTQPVKLSEELVSPIPPNGLQIKVEAPEQLSVGVLQENDCFWTLHSCMEPNITTCFDAKGLISASRSIKCADSTCPEHTLL